ncbi:MAG: hypothetical protein KF749_02965 [Bacteroidetes bacterium]|nr:hypothetical protein [Bacteroidota bacterium]MCW5896777.1 hypothetical protein [Bacteroidota bacterium]
MKNASVSVLSSHKLAKGLATLALLKANYDSGIDHLDMLLPFVADCIICFPYDDFSAQDMRNLLTERYGLKIPTTSMQMLLTRASKRKLVRREGGRYFRDKVSRTTTPDISKRLSEIQTEHAVIAKALMHHAQQHNLKLQNEDDALALLFEFISQFHVELLLDPSTDEGGGPVFQDQFRSLGTKELRIVARFVLAECLANQELRRIVRRVLEGYVLQNALLLKDISTAQSRFKDLTAYFDTAFLLNALGLTGDAAKVAARESLDLLKVTNVSLAVFDTTVEEIRRILHVYERHLATQKGIETLRAYPITRHLLARRYSPSDVREESAMLRSHLRDLGFRIVPVPDHIDKFTLDEADLTRRLKRPAESDTEPRVVHDVDCVASVLTVRKGRHPQSYDSAKAVFVTTTGLLVKNVKEWFRGQGQIGVYPVIHSSALSSIAWLKKPTAIADLKLNELIALCSAALVPSQRTWDLFVKHLQNMRTENRINDDEMVAVIASELTENLLSQFDEDVEPDSTTLTEVVNRVKESYASEAEAKIEKIRGEASQEIAAVHAEKTQVQVRLEESETRQRELMLALRGRAKTIALIVGKVFFIFSIVVLLVCPFMIGTIITGIWARIIGGIVWVSGVAGLVWGWYVKQWQNAVEFRIESLLRRFFHVSE